MAKKKKAPVKAQHQGPTPELPPKVPHDRKQLERAIMLLGSRAKGLELNTGTRVELLALVGAYPVPATAANWKLGLKSVRDDEIFDAVG